jgi:hypothetical protein
MVSKTFIGILLMLCVTGRGYAQGGGPLYKDSVFIRAVLQEHNNFRAELQLPALTWSDALAVDAQAWAMKLARKGDGEHDMSVRGKEGENLWWGTAGAFSYGQMVDFWGAEKENFVYGTYPDCVKKKGAVVGHYTQMVWKTTTQVGCALVSNKSNDFLVCRYGPPGNMIGAKPY